jgi:DNA-binding MarR family transcriptional regulator
MNSVLEFLQALEKAYRDLCSPLCRDLGFTQTAFDILMFLGNNPSRKTARDIVEIRRLKANLVSVNVDRLVRDGYLIRRSAPGDRRKVELECTSKAQPVILRGRELQRRFHDLLFKDVSEKEKADFNAVLNTMASSLNHISEEIQ